MSESLSRLYLSNPALATALRRRQGGEQLLQQGMDTSPTNWAGALARLAQAYVGNRDVGRADEQIKGIGEQQDQEFRDFNRPTPAGAPPAPVPVASPSPSPPSPPLASGTGADIPPELVPHYQAASQATGIPVAVLAAKDKQESGFRNTLRGGAGEIGIAQVLPSTANAPGYGMSPVSPEQLAADPAANIMFGAQYLAGRGKSAGVTDWNDPAQVAKALAAYNGGGDPNYVANVTRYLPPGFGGRGGAAPPPGGPVADAGGPASGSAPDMPSGPPRASPLADVYLQQAMALQRKAQQAAASSNPRIQAQAPVLMQQATLYAGLAKEKPKTNVLRPGGMLVDDQGRVIARAPDDTGPLNVIQNGVDEKGNPRFSYATRPQAVGQTAPTPGPLLSIDQRGANAEVQERGAGLAKAAGTIRDEAAAAAGTIDQVRQLRNIGAETSRLAPAQEVIGGALDALGVKGTDLVRKATTLQQFNGALSGLVLGAQLQQKGVQTEGDANRMREQYAKATNTMEANEFLMRATEAQATRKMEQHDFYENWFREHKTYDGASQGWNKFIRDVPMTIRGPNGVAFFNEAQAAARAAGVPDSDFLAQWRAKAVVK